MDNCPSYEEPVCSSNGTTYDNKCVFQREMCHLKANFTLYHPGDCTGNVSEIYSVVASQIKREKIIVYVNKCYMKYMLFTGWEVRIVKNCDRGLENAARGRRPRAAFSRQRSQFFTIRTDPKPVNNLFIFFLLG